MTDNDAWGAYWSGQNSGCLPAALDVLGRITAGCWREFAARLPRKTRTLDLATGNGIVLLEIQRGRPDLRLVGVDLAPQLPPAGHGISLKAGIAIEQLPFRDGAFGAITSQFGFEYGDTARAAVEVRRVLAPSGQLRMIVHRRGGPIVAHNVARRHALHWAVVESGVLSRAKAAVAARQLVPIPIPHAFRAALGEAGRRYPVQSVAAEIMQGILQALEAGGPVGLGHLEFIEKNAAQELARLDALDRVAADSERIAAMANEMRAANLRVDDPRPLVDRSGSAFAWLIDATA